MFDSIVNTIKNGDYPQAIIRTRIILSIYQTNIMKFQDVEEHKKLELFNLTGEKLIDEKLLSHQLQIMEELYDLLIKTYQLENKIEKFPKDELLSLQDYDKYITKVIDAKRDKKVIESIKKFDRDLLNTDEWDYNDQMSDKLKTLVEAAKTQDVSYISKLSDLLQAIEDEVPQILLVGESGVGKTMLAKIIHSISNRSEKGYEAISCGDFRGESILNQKLFGWEKESHNTATKENKGLIEKLKGGILFLDEIDRMPDDARDAIITFVETKRFQRLGADQFTDADVHLIFGTNKDLKKLILEEKFESDFYYRISKFVMTIPPLRDRKGDIDLILDSSLVNYNKKFSSQISITAEAKILLKSYPWYGNFRVLEDYLNLIFRKAKNSKEKYVTPDLIKKYPPDMLSSEITIEYKNLFQNLEKTLDEMFFYWYTSVYPKQTLEETEGAEQKNKDGFLQQLVTPILANIYNKLDLTDFEMQQKIKNKKAREIIGIGGLPSGKDQSSIDKALETYGKLVEQIK
jgi:DNA-binding NtrC family response regulator